MIKSMTGFGRATKENKLARVEVEIKSLNSKFTDLNLRIPRDLSDKEIEVRNVVTQQLERGKISTYIDIAYTSTDNARSSINQDLFRHYYTMLSQAALSCNASTDGLVQTILTFPDVIVSNSNSDSQEEITSLMMAVLNDALKSVDEFRISEGKALEGKFEEYIQNIADKLDKVEQQDPVRMQNIRAKLQGAMDEIKQYVQPDPSRLEQELIFYIEKLDITEEKVRLKNHLEFFIKNLHSKENTGKKLGFIAQEIGREINTIGSKANDVEIQKCVVDMKDELEKIKEQLNNIL